MIGGNDGAQINDYNKMKIEFPFNLETWFNDHGKILRGTLLGLPYNQTSSFNSIRIKEIYEVRLLIRNLV